MGLSIWLLVGVLILLKNMSKHRKFYLVVVISAGNFQNISLNFRVIVENDYYIIYVDLYINLIFFFFLSD